ncbi:MAG: CPBP family intramembrane metalloprotease [Clostridia bacterium]|nr:CPBP family intramembrane metalloprotease [Clostridia bacterium]
MDDTERKLLVLARSNADKSGLYFSVICIAELIIAVIFTASFAPFINGGENGLLKDVYSFLSFSLGGITILLTTFIFSKFSGLKISDVINYSPVSVKFLLPSALLFIGMTFGLSGLNGYFIEFLSKFGYKPAEITLPGFSVVNFIAVILTVCVLPAIAEEVAFRGFAAFGLRPLGMAICALVNGFIFAVYHKNPAQTPYQFLVGVALCMLAYKSGSLFWTSAIHFLNNLLIVCVSYFAPNATIDFGTVGKIITTIVGVICTVAFFVLMLKKSDDNKPTFAAGWLVLKRFLLFAVFGITACLFLWIAALFA